jgi:hypothetical protein
VPYDFYIKMFLIHVQLFPCHNSMERPQVADGEDGYEMWMAVANVLNKQSRRGDRGWSFSLVVGRGRVKRLTIEPLIFYATF